MVSGPGQSVDGVRTRSTWSCANVTDSVVPSSFLGQNGGDTSSESMTFIKPLKSSKPRTSRPQTGMWGLKTGLQTGLQSRDKTRSEPHRTSVSFGRFKSWMSSLIIHPWTIMRGQECVDQSDQSDQSEFGSFYVVFIQNEGNFQLVSLCFLSMPGNSLVQLLEDRSSKE